MSLASLRFRFDLASFPRVSGDEPNLAGFQKVADAFSPRERG